MEKENISRDPVENRPKAAVYRVRIHEHELFWLALAAATVFVAWVLT